MSQISPETSVYFIHPVVNGREFWAYWTSYQLFCQGNSPQEYQIFSDQDQARQIQLKRRWQMAVCLDDLSLEQKKQIYRQVRFAELPEEVQTTIQGKLAEKAKLKRAQQQALLAALGLSEVNLLELNPRMLKRLYRQLAFQYHPDQGGCPEDFHHFQVTYQALLRWL